MWPGPVGPRNVRRGPEEAEEEKSTTHGTTTRRLPFKAKRKVKFAWPKRKKAPVILVDDDSLATSGKIPLPIPRYSLADVSGR